jgi:hypothetical protein
LVRQQSHGLVLPLTPGAHPPATAESGRISRFPGRNQTKLALLSHGPSVPLRGAFFFTANMPICRLVGLDWRLDRVYFLAFLNPREDNRIQPLPPG